MAAGESSGNSLENTPTWAVAIVCFIIISVSIFLEHSIHLLTNMLKRHRRTALNDAAYRLKSELMLPGLMSLLLAVAQDAISNICISRNIADIMLPCPKNTDTKLSTKDDYERFGRRSLLTTDGLYNGKLQIPNRSLLADDMVDQSVISSCSSKGKVALITQEGIHQLQIFIIVLSVMQIVYSVLTVAFGKAKMRRWKAWEKETQTADYLIENDPNRFSLTRQTIFGRRHESFTETWIHLWLKCVFRQFFHSIAKVDYHTLRHSFITAHLSSKSNSTFNFHKYIQTTLDEDFKIVVSIRPYMWCIVVIFLLLNIHGWHTYYRWVSLVPFLIMVLIGTKLETIVVRMALRLKNHKSVIIGNPVVQPHDDLFWFNRPTFLLSLLHFTLFLNAFEVAFFIWVTIQFGWDSCYYHEHTLITIARIGLAVSVQVLCSYITLPLYALVAQMGSQFKSKLLEERMAKMLKQWHDEVKAKRKKHKEQSLQSASTSLSIDLSFRDISLPRDDQLSSDHHHHHPTSMPTEPNPRTSQNMIQEEEEIVEEANSSKVLYPII